MANPPVKSNPDPQEFAREVLHHLCALRAETAILIQMLSRQIEPDITKANSLYRSWMKDAGKIQRDLYQKALDRVGVRPKR
jgi:hypothetical protein